VKKKNEIFNDEATRGIRPANLAFVRVFSGGFCAVERFWQKSTTKIVRRNDSR